MNKLKNKILEKNFPKFFRRFVIAAVLAVLASGIGAGIAAAPQISDAITREREEKQLEKQLEKQQEEQAGAYHGEEDRKDHDMSQKESHDEIHFFDGLTVTGKLLLGVFAGICMVAAIIYWLTVAAWLYQTAVRSGLHGLVWFFLALAGNLAAVIGFLLVRSFLREKCGSCGKWQSRKNVFCTACGKAMHRTCPSCQKVCGPDEKFCRGCGKELEDIKKD